MLIRLISLVFLFTIANSKMAFSLENNEFIYPQKKPSIFKKIFPKQKNKIQSLVPKKKPTINVSTEKKIKF